MNKRTIHLCEALISDEQPSKVSQPCNCPLDNRAMAIAPQLASILMRCPPMPRACWDDGLNAALCQTLAEGIGVIRPIQNQALGFLARTTGPMAVRHSDSRQGSFQQGHFCRGCRVQVNSQRSTRAIDQNHTLCAFATLGLADVCAPLFAGTKVPSAKHSSQRIFSPSLRSARKVRQSRSNVPFSSHSRSRRQQVLGLPYSAGKALQGAPVHRIQRMPSKHLRSAARGRPPFGLGLTTGSWTRMRSHWVSVSLPRYAIPQV